MYNYTDTTNGYIICCILYEKREEARMFGPVWRNTCTQRTHAVSFPASEQHVAQSQKGTEKKGGGGGGGGGFFIFF